MSAVVDDPMHKLSGDQKSILLYLYNWHEWVNEHGSDYRKRICEIWGYPWSPGKDWDVWTRAESAALSRALRRLEERGLVIRNNDISGPSARKTADYPAPKRTTRVKFTAMGLEASKRLTLLQRDEC